MSGNPFATLGVRSVINAAGKMTALGGTAQHPGVAQAQAVGAKAHVDMAELRTAASRAIARMTGAEAASITPGAAAGIAIGVAAILTGSDLEAVRRVPDVEGSSTVLLQAGHDVDFGAPVTQMIRLGGGRPLVFGNRDRVTGDDLKAALREDVAAIVYVKSHHCLQENRLPLDALTNHGVPVLVDAAAEEDLRSYVAAGADLVTYSGGKAIGGPTTGFIVGRADLIEACELQQAGIARAMKVGKEQIMGLMAALDRYQNRIERHDILRPLRDTLAACERLCVSIAADRAGRDIKRVAVEAKDFDIRDLVRFLADGDPSIRTRNHQIGDGVVLFDVRELQPAHVRVIGDRVSEFFAQS